MLQAVRPGIGVYRTAGVDQASERDFNVRVSEQGPNGERKAIWIGRLGSWRAVADLMMQLRVTFCAIDAGPERRGARGVIGVLGGRGVLVEYGGPQESAFTYKERENTVRVNRTEAIDAMMDGIRLMRNLPLREPPPGYIAQLMAPRRRATVNPKTEKVVRTYVSLGPDDYAHAEVYDMVAAEMLKLHHQAGALLEDRPVSDQEIGFQRTGLDAPFGGDPRRDGFGSYDAGFGEEGLLS